MGEQSSGKTAHPMVQLRVAQLALIIAEGDLVNMSFVQEYPDPADSTKKYTTTWFDTFRIQNGKIVEHWDSALKNPPRPQ